MVFGKKERSFMLVLHCDSVILISLIIEMKGRITAEIEIVEKSVIENVLQGEKGFKQYFQTDEMIKVGEDSCSLIN